MCSSGGSGPCICNQPQDGVCSPIWVRIIRNVSLPGLHSEASASWWDPYMECWCKRAQRREATAIRDDVLPEGHLRHSWGCREGHFPIGSETSPAHSFNTKEERKGAVFCCSGTTCPVKCKIYTQSSWPRNTSAIGLCTLSSTQRNPNYFFMSWQTFTCEFKDQGHFWEEQLWFEPPQANLDFPFPEERTQCKGGHLLTSLTSLPLSLCLAGSWRC